MHLTLDILAAAIMLLAGIVGVVLTLATLPGVWLTLGIALLCEWVFGEPRLFDWWTLGLCAGLGIAGEFFELISGAVGAKKAGGGKASAIGSIVGAFVGALVGSFVILIPVAGTLIGTVVGAAAGAIAGERAIAGREWSHALRVGQFAAAGRLLATVIKAALAALVGMILAVAALVP